MRIIASLLAVTACLVLAQPAAAGTACAAGSCVGSADRCAGCGCHAPCRQVKCQIICDYEEVEVKCWDVKCEDYCLPLPVLGSCLKDGCKSCNAGNDCGCDTGCGSSCGKNSGLLLNNRCANGKCEPTVTCGHPRVKKKLMLRTMTVKKPIYKCVTSYLCGGCEADSQEVAPVQSAPAPKAAPAPEAAPLPTAPKQAFIPTFPRFE